MAASTPDDDPDPNELAALPERLRRRLTVDPNGCWVWTGPQYRDGYGMVYVLGSGRGPLRRYTRSHRVVWETLRGPIPDGLELDHLADVCGNKLCANPQHLEPVTHAENVRRWAATRPDRTRCHKGHAYTPANIYTYPDGRRECRTCRSDRIDRHAQNRVLV